MKRFKMINAILLFGFFMIILFAFKTNALINIDASIWQIDTNHGTKWNVNNTMPVFSYSADGNITIDFNVASDTNFGYHYADLNYSTSKTQGTGTPIVSNQIMDGNRCQTNFIGTWNNTANSDSSLVGYWKFDSQEDVNTLRLFDYSGKNNHGQYYNGADNNAQGKWDNNAFYADNIDDFASVAETSDLNFSNKISLAMWLKINPTQIISIDVGTNHSCAVLESGKAVCWGQNTYGQLGNGNTINSGIPVTVVGINNFSQITAGDSHSCGVDTNGQAQCWGRNNNGQLGDGTTTDKNTPVTVIGINNFSQITTGTYHSCGVDTNGQAQCWGYNSYGQLGDGTKIDKNNPVTVIGINNFSQISTGSYYSCGVDTNGQAQCWGYNANGQLGDGTTTDKNTPVTVIGINNFSQITTGTYHSCGVDTNGQAQCWGANNNGRLGDGTTTQRTTPVTVAGINNFSQITAGDSHSCGVDTNGQAQCWGLNDNGQLGDGTTTQRTTPVTVAGINNFSKITAGTYHSCGVDTNGQAQCWGNDNNGQLGNGTIVNQITPATVFGIPNFSQISAGNSFSCGVDTNGQAQCWGLNTNGALGDGTTVNKIAPITVFGINNFSQISAGDAHACGVDNNGQAQCWGLNAYGRLGEGTSGQRQIPVTVIGITNFSQISAGYQFSCGVDTNGQAQCWGRNTSGQLGDGTVTNKSWPVTVFGINNFSQISAGSNHACGVDTNGQAQCWGYNSYGRLGDGTTTDRNTPVTVIGINNFSQITAGYNHSCGVDTNGQAQCWGRNNKGQLGDGTTTDKNTPVTVIGINNFSQITTGTYHSCGVDSNGQAQCWGYNNNGQLGDGTTTDKNTPVTVLGDYNFTSIDAGAYHTCGVLTNGTSVCWGENSNGQLGTGVSAIVTSPKPVIKGILVGKSPQSFAIVSTFDNNFAGFINKTGFFQSLNSDWHHIALTYDSIAGQSMYIDGELIKTETNNTQNLINSEIKNLTIGERANGNIEELKIYNRTLTAAEVSQDYNLGAQNFRSCKWDWNISDVADANYYATVLVRDDTGNSDFNASDSSFRVNPLPSNPTIAITSMNPDKITETTATITYLATAEGGLKNYWVKVDSGDWTDNGTNTTYDFSIGTESLPSVHSFYVKATDNFDQNSEIASKKITFESATGGEKPAETSNSNTIVITPSEKETITKVEQFLSVEKVFTPLELENISILDSTEKEIQQNVKKLATKKDLSLSRSMVIQSYWANYKAVNYSNKITVSFENISGKQLHNIELIEEIPKDFANSAKLVHSDYNFEIIENDPIIKFFIGDLNAGQKATVSYDFNKETVEKNVLEEQFGKITAPIVLLKLEENDACLNKICDDYDACTRNFCEEGKCVFLPLKERASCGIGKQCIKGECIAATTNANETGQLPPIEGKKEQPKNPEIAIITIVLLGGILALIVYFLKKKNK